MSDSGTWEDVLTDSIGSQSDYAHMNRKTQSHRLQECHPFKGFFFVPQEHTHMKQIKHMMCTYAQE